jgi:hypothetical protein
LYGVRTDPRRGLTDQLHATWAEPRWALRAAGTVDVRCRRA